jgi:hypothetical protein
MQKTDRNSFNSTDNGMTEYLLLSVHIIWFYTMHYVIYLRMNMPAKNGRELSLT